MEEKSYTTYKKEPFVKKELDRVREERGGEDSARPAQSEHPTPKTAEEVNLIQKTEVRMKTLLQSLNSIESLTSALNKNLLPMEMQSEAGTEVDKNKPQGWWENHIENLESLISRAGQIHYQVQRLAKATNIEKAGQ